MAITNTDRWHLCVLIGGNDLRMYEIPRDPQIEEAVLAGVTEFWAHVEKRTPPNPETPDEVKLRWPKDLGTSVVATAEIIERLDTYRVLKATEKCLEVDLDNARADAQRFMQEAAQLVDGDGHVLATWRTAKDSTKFDVHIFEREEPDLHRQYLRAVPGSRRFILK